jgi:phospholipase C
MTKPEPNYLSRRTVLGGALALGGLAGASAMGLSSGNAVAAARKKVGKRAPGSLPDPSAAAGTDQLPEITNIVAVMMENHTYDSILGMLPRGNAGFTLGTNGQPTNSNPWPTKGSTFPPPGKDAVLSAFPMPTPCQLSLAGVGYPWNTWEAGHVSYNNGKMDGFVQSQSGPVAMGYYDSSTIPFVYSLANTFPLCTNFFSSVMAQTYPNRRYFMGGTSLGLIVDTLNDDVPPNGTIFEALNKYGITWKNYSSNTPSILIWSYLANEKDMLSNVSTISDFYSDCAAGTLPSYSMVDPNFEDSSEEDPQDVQNGDYFLSQVINAVLDSPQWPHTLLVWTYDEGGGYYDHVKPPAAIEPDDVGPIDADPAGSFNQYGFRVPSGVVSPYAKADYVSTVTHDFTSILKLIETKWNLPALTYRDANADNLLDSVDLTGTPAFLKPPKLADAIVPSTNDRCLTTGPGTIPPPSYVTTK